MGCVSLRYHRSLMARRCRAFNRTHALYPGPDLVKDIPYVDDGARGHLLDVFRPRDPNGCLIMNVHGGAYVFGWKEDSSVYASVFAKMGFTVINVNYRLIDEHDGLTVRDQVRDVMKAMLYCYRNRENLGLDFAHFALMGDSSGGQLALLAALASSSEEAKDHFGISLPPMRIRALALNSPMYDYLEVAAKARKYLSRKAMAATFSKDWEDKGVLAADSPRHYLKKGLALPPVFVSTSRRDFWRRQPTLLKDDLVRYGLDHVFYYDDFRERRYRHVYNHFLLDDPKAIDLNKAMAAFLRRTCLD